MEGEGSMRHESHDGRHFIKQVGAILYGLGLNKRFRRWRLHPLLYPNSLLFSLCEGHGSAHSACSRRSSAITTLAIPLHGVCNEATAVGNELLATLPVRTWTRTSSYRERQVCPRYLGGDDQRVGWHGTCQRKNLPRSTRRTCTRGGLCLGVMSAVDVRVTVLGD